MAKNSNYHRADVALLRAENEALKEKGTFLEEKNALLERQLSQQSAQIEELKRKLEHMNEVFANAQRAQYGQKSEKQQYVLGEDQVSLFNEAEASQDHKAAEPTEQTLVAAHSRKKKKTLEEKIKELPVEEIIMDLPEDQLTCSCGGTFRLIGKKFIRQEMIIIPQSEKILKYYSCTYACDKCEKDTGYAHILTTKTPPPLMKHSIASPSTVADVMTKKYADGLPLARQEKIWKRYGVELSRATLANWVIQCSQSWLKPLYKHMRQQLLEERVIHADETVVQVLKEEGKTVTSESRMWMYASGEYSKKPIRLFEYQPDRKGERCKVFLKGFKGHLVTDGYSGYNLVEGVTHCGCWQHMKRKWRDAMPDGATVKTSKAAVGFQYCNKLFALEKKCQAAAKGCKPEYREKYRKEYRQANMLPVLEEYFCWVNTLNPEKGSNLEKAVTYAKNQKEALSRFLEDGNLPISNNLAENAIRPFAVGRKNWLFCDSVKGADSSAIVYSMVETAKANGVEPYDYLLLVLSILPSWGKNPSHEKLETLMPWHPDVKQRKHVREDKAE